MQMQKKLIEKKLNNVCVEIAECVCFILGFWRRFNKCIGSTSDADGVVEDNRV